MKFYATATNAPTDPTATLDTEFSGDVGAFADCAEEIGTGLGSGFGLITLTGAETNFSVLGVQSKSGNCFTVLQELFPRSLPSIGTGTLSAGSAGGGTLGTLLAYDVTGCFIQTTGGTGGGGTGGANNQARRIVTYNIRTGAFTVVPNWEVTPSTDTTYTVLLPEGVTLGMIQAEALPSSVNDAGATTTSFIGASELSATDDFYNSASLTFTKGALKGIARRITNYVGSTRTLEFSTAFPSAPANGDTFHILGLIE